MAIRERVLVARRSGLASHAGSPSNIPTCLPLSTASRERLARTAGNVREVPNQCGDLGRPSGLFAVAPPGKDRSPSAVSAVRGASRLRPVGGRDPVIE
jgi:hypothetical protein